MHVHIVQMSGNSGSTAVDLPGPSRSDYSARPYGKRARDEDEMVSPHRRRRLDTPTKQAIGRLQPATSPLVAV